VTLDEIDVDWSCNCESVVRIWRLFRFQQSCLKRWVSLDLLAICVSLLETSDLDSGSLGRDSDIMGNARKLLVL
jgi:hypothetical protein